MRLTRCFICDRILYANRIPFICNACRLHYTRRILVAVAVAIPILAAILTRHMVAR